MTDQTVTPATFPEGVPLDLSALERLAIAEALRRVGGNRTHAARLLGIGLRTLRNKLREYRQSIANEAEAVIFAALHELPTANGETCRNPDATSEARFSQE